MEDLLLNRINNSNMFEESEINIVENILPICTKLYCLGLLDYARGPVEAPVQSNN